MFLRPNHRHKDGKDHTYWSLVETVRTPDGPRQRTLVLPGRTERLGAGALAEDDRGLQRAGREPATEAVSLRRRTAGEDAVGGAGAADQVRLERVAAVWGLVSWRWSCGSVWSWTASGRGCWTGRKMPPTYPGRGWRRCWRSTGCVRRAASWRSRSAGIRPRRWTTCWGSRKARSTTRACIAVWTVCCRTRRNWSGI